MNALLTEPTASMVFIAILTALVVVAAFLGIGLVLAALLLWSQRGRANQTADRDGRLLEVTLHQVVERIDRLSARLERVESHQAAMLDFLAGEIGAETALGRAIKTRTRLHLQAVPDPKSTAEEPAP